MKVILKKGIDMRNQFRSKNIPDPNSIGQAASNNYVDNLFNDPSIIKKHCSC